MTNEKAKDPSTIVVPFGKYKGRTVAELIETDQNYAHWVTNQAWVAERFAELHAAILNRGAAPDDSPEHNAVQVRFLDQSFAVAAVLAAHPDALSAARAMHAESEAWDDRVRLNTALRRVQNKKDELASSRHWLADADPKWRERAAERIPEQEAELIALQAKVAEAETALDAARVRRFPLKVRVQFEQRGIDVLLAIGFGDNPDFYGDRGTVARIEIKPTMGDDFPSVMRQMQRLGCDTLVLGEYTGRAVTAPQVRQMFEANGQKLVFVRDIEAELANARAEVQP